ncbi:MAG TPA: sulfur globule protein precursor [Xanthobacteraceae bacterium]|jgi:hypothetical protein|nr:sulfur globule protein precursor [Xanthobacteraceae bacterium]
MLRKTMLALATCVTLGAAALAPTSASAHWNGGGWHGGGWHGGWHGGWGYRPIVRVYAPGPYYGGGCMVRRWVPTPYGPALRWVNRCY